MTLKWKRITQVELVKMYPRSNAGKPYRATPRPSPAGDTPLPAPLPDDKKEPCQKSNGKGWTEDNHMGDTQSDHCAEGKP